MGGQNSEIKDNTVDVLIESAYFSPTNIRRTSKTLGLRTDASYRFERGADIDINDWASARCAQLILETAGGQLAEGLVDAYPNPVEPKQITLRHHKVNELLGIELRPEEIEFYLGQLGLKTTGHKAAPSRRQRRAGTGHVSNSHVPRGLEARGGLDRGSRPAAWRGQNSVHAAARRDWHERIRRDARRPGGSAADFERAGLE